MPILFGGRSEVSSFRGAWKSYLYFLSTEEEVLTLHPDSRAGQPPDLKAFCISEFPNLGSMFTACKGWRAP